MSLFKIHPEPLSQVSLERRLIWPRNFLCLRVNLQDLRDLLVALQCRIFNRRKHSGGIRSSGRNEHVHFAGCCLRVRLREVILKLTFFSD